MADGTSATAPRRGRPLSVRGRPLVVGGGYAGVPFGAQAGNCDHGLHDVFLARLGCVRRLPDVHLMRLSDAAGSAFELTVTGYQFPDSTWREKKYSWHMVGGAATVENDRWNFHWQALTCDETPMVSAWLRSVADWIDAAGTGSGEPAAVPTPLTFTEPNLAFRLVPADGRGLPEVEIQLRLEFRHPARLKSPSPVGAVPIMFDTGTRDLPFDALRITASAAELRRAAAEWDAERAPYPNGLVGVTVAERRAELEERRARGGDWMSG